MVAFQLEPELAASNNKQPAINSKALAWTIGVHALLLLLFILLTYTITAPPPLPPDGGLEVNLGTSENGSGNNQPMSTKDPAAYQASVVYKAVAAKSNIPKDIARSTEADAPIVDNTKNKKNKPTEAKPVEKPLPKPVPEKPKYMMPASTGKGGNSATQNKPGGSEGITKGPGDQGVPGGTPGATNYSGIPGNGNGNGRIGHTLTGRSISPSTFSTEFHEGGKVTIRVTVDKAGNIISKSVVSFSSAELKAKAMEIISKAKFSPSDGSEPEQHGIITINFTTRQ